MKLEKLNCSTRLTQIHIPNTSPLTICSLLDRQQYSDPDGTTEKVGISSALWPISGLLWPSAYYLATELAQADLTPYENILEIGCGLALPSLIAHRMGHNVTASDHNPVSAAFLERNLKINQLEPDLLYRYGHWGEPPTAAYTEFPDSILSGRYELVIGSDLLYEPNSAAKLADFIDQHISQQGQIWLVDVNRGYLSAFKAGMVRHGFTMFDRQILNCKPCKSGAPSYKGRLMKFKRA